MAAEQPALEAHCRPDLRSLCFSCILSTAARRPLLALPAGYGTAFSGVAPMLAALNSSAPGVTVVNIDSGFGASMAAWRILKNAARIRQAAMGAASS